MTGKKEQKHTYIAAFDLDRTIISLNSSNLIVSASRKMGLMTRKQMAEAIWFSIIYKFDLQDPTKIVLSMMKWLHGQKEKDIIRLTTEHIVPALIKVIRPEIKQAITGHQENGGKVIILSSALPYLCMPISEHLKMDDVICSRIEIREEKFTGNAIGKLVYRGEKEVRMRKYCEEHNFPLHTAWYYGDAYTDRHVMNIVGNPVCVSPEIKLRMLALRKGWQIL